jgi:hypothetical protein
MFYSKGVFAMMLVVGLVCWCVLGFTGLNIITYQLINLNPDLV